MIVELNQHYKGKIIFSKIGEINNLPKKNEIFRLNAHLPFRTTEISYIDIANQVFMTEAGDYSWRVLN